MTKVKEEEKKELRDRIKYLEKRLKEETCWINKNQIRRNIERIENLLKED